MSVKDIVINTIVNFLKQKRRATIPAIHDHLFTLSMEDDALKSSISFSGRYSDEVDRAIEMMIDSGAIGFDGVSCYVVGGMASIKKEEDMDPSITMMANGLRSFLEKVCRSPISGEKMEVKLDLILDNDTIEMRLDNPDSCGSKGQPRSWRVSLGQQIVASQS